MWYCLLIFLIAKYSDIYFKEKNSTWQHQKRFIDGCGGKHDRNVKKTESLQFPIINLKRMKGKVSVITICVFKRCILKHDKGITSLIELIELISSEIKQISKKFTFQQLKNLDKQDEKGLLKQIPQTSKLQIT